MKPHYSKKFYRAFWFDAGAAAARFLGMRNARCLGRILGQLYAWTCPKTCATLRANLRAVCGPRVDRRLVHRTFRNFGAMLADYFTMGACSKQKAASLIGEIVGFEHVQAALAEGKGALLVTVHMGLFELGSALMENSKLPLVVLSLPEPDPLLNRWRANYRRRWNVETLEIGTDQFSFVEIARQLASGKCVALLMDRPRGGEDTVLLDLPHGQIPFSAGPVWLSLLAGCPLVEVTMVAMPSGRYAMVARPPVKPVWGTGDRAETVRRYTRQLAATFCETICAHPDQWYQFAPLSTSR